MNFPIPQRILRAKYGGPLENSVVLNGGLRILNAKAQYIVYTHTSYMQKDTQDNKNSFTVRATHIQIIHYQITKLN